jgi:hypothetical protein
MTNEEKHEQQQPQVLRLRGSPTRTTSLRMTHLLVGNTNRQRQKQISADGEQEGKCRGNGNGETS